jgi:hypothetical protein
MWLERVGIKAKWKVNPVDLRYRVLEFVMGHSEPKPLQYETRDQYVDRQVKRNSGSYATLAEMNEVYNDWIGDLRHHNIWPIRGEGSMMREMFKKWLAAVKRT